jgi:hypothetical protein
VNNNCIDEEHCGRLIWRYEIRISITDAHLMFEKITQLNENNKNR